MKKYQTGHLSDLEVGQSFRILSGRLSDYSKVWTLRDVTTVYRIFDTRGVYKVLFGFEAETMEVEAAS